MRNEPAFVPDAKGTVKPEQYNRRRNAVASTINKHIRIGEEFRQRLEEAARERAATANRLLGELATQWLESRKWPRTDAQVQVTWPRKMTPSPLSFSGHFTHRPATSLRPFLPCLCQRLKGSGHRIRGIFERIPPELFVFLSPPAAQRLIGIRTVVRQGQGMRAEVAFALPKRFASR